MDSETWGLELGDKTFPDQQIKIYPALEPQKNITWVSQVSPLHACPVTFPQISHKTFIISRGSSISIIWRSSSCVNKQGVFIQNVTPLHFQHSLFLCIFLCWSVCLLCFFVSPMTERHLLHPAKQEKQIWRPNDMKPLHMPVVTQKTFTAPILLFLPHSLASLPWIFYSE